MKWIVALVFLIPFVSAQLDWSITDLRCGNDKLDEFEMCEDGMGDGFCKDLGKILKVASVCDKAHCTCLPRVNKAYCGNDIREGIEVCDGTAEDFCDELGDAMNLSLTCNKKTCGCDIKDNIPVDYNPATVEELVNKSQQTATCGDKKVERDEECDPPQTLCTTNKDGPGICDDSCKCVPPELYGAKEEPIVEEAPVEEVNESKEEPIQEDEVVEEESKEEEPEKPGFFARVWAWIVALFS